MIPTFPDSKLTSELEFQLERSDPAGLVEVVVELGGGSRRGHREKDRTKAIAARREAFEDETKDLTHLVQNLGGEVLDMAWINRTIRCRIPAGGVASLSSAKSVALLDIPHILHRD
jgi:hypothetical protein